MSLVGRLTCLGLIACACLGLLACLGCAALQADREPRGPEFLARQYLERGRAAWAAGNEANARFLIGRAVELDPAGEAALALWKAHWSLDALPPAALAARSAWEARSREPAPPPGVERTSSPDAARESREKAPAGEGRSAGDGGVVRVAATPVRITTLAELAEIRSAFGGARARGDRAELKRAGEELLRARPFHLADVHAVLSSWVDARVDTAREEARLRDILGSLEFGDQAYLAGKPPDVEDSSYLRGYRGRFLDLLGWSAFLRGDMAQAEAALRSAETEINLRGRGDVSHLRHLASFYERRGDLAKAESYAIAAAARDTGASGAVRALAARLWSRRHGGTAGLAARLAAESERARREKRSAAIAGRLYAPLPMLEAARQDGGALTDLTLRGRVTVLVLWKPGCEDCLRLLRDLASRQAGGGRSASSRDAQPEVVALDIGGDAAAGKAALGTLPRIAYAAAGRPQAFANAVGASSLPFTLVIEPAGLIQYRHGGYPDETAAREAWLERLGWQVSSLAALAPEGGRRRATRAGAQRGAGAR